MTPLDILSEAPNRGVTNDRHNDNYRVPFRLLENSTGITNDDHLRLSYLYSTGHNLFCLTIIDEEKTNI
jgi:hypothetical protein